MRKFSHKHITIYALLINIILIYLSGCGYFKKSKPKILLIGLDGASWNVIQPLLEQGKLPNIKDLMARGCWGVLKSFQPLTSEVIWTTIATGMIPQKHGIIHRLIEDPGSGELVPSSSNLRKVKAIWNILSENNKKVGMVHYMVTWPVEKINGVMISGRIADLEDVGYQSQDRAYPRFSSLCSKEEFENFKTLKHSIFSGIERSRFPRFWWSIESIDNFTVNFSQYLLKKEDFDFFRLYIRGTDIISHRFWSFLFPEGFNVSEKDIQRYSHAINDYYIWCDRVIGDLLRIIDKDTTVIIVSDHGFTKDINGAYRFSKVDYLLEACGINKIKKGDKTIILKNEPRDTNSFDKHIKIIGSLPEKEFSEVREEAKNVLKNIKVMETGDYLIEDFQDTQSGFLIKTRQAYLSQDLKYHFTINGKEYKISDLIIDNIHTGMHSKSAIIIISGKHILCDKRITTATINDITPTILYYMGFPVARDMDGRVLTEAMEEGYAQRNPVRYIDSYETGKKRMPQKPMRSLLDEEKIKERMRSLGYIN